MIKWNGFSEDQIKKIVTAINAHGFDAFVYPISKNDKIPLKKYDEDMQSRGLNPDGTIITWEPILKFMITFDGKNEGHVIKSLIEAKLDFLVNFTTMDLLEINPHGVSKAFPIDFYNQHLRDYQTKGKIFAIGDGNNDIQMLKHPATIGIAVQNANQNVKDAANYVTKKTNHEAALAEAYEQIILPEVNKIQNSQGFNALANYGDSLVQSDHE